MTRRPPDWLEASVPWNNPVPTALCAGVGVSPHDVPVVDLPGAPLSALELIALRGGRFVPWFGYGPTRSEAVRAMATVVRALGATSDPRGTEHALAMAMHPVLGVRPLKLVATASENDPEARWCARVAVSALGLLGSSDALREQFARELGSVPGLVGETAIALGAGGGDLGTFRENYTSLVTTLRVDAPTIRVVRGFFDFVLARRFSGLDHLRALHDPCAADPASLWLISAAELIAGDDRARHRMTELAERMLAPLSPLLPKLMTVAAQEMNKLVGRPLHLRFLHLRCAASRDHAAAAIRAWLAAATEAHDHAGEDDRALGPEPSRAGKTAIAARERAGEFLLDWFVPDRDAREQLDQFVRTAFRLYHRLRGAQLFAVLVSELDARPTSPGVYDKILWGT